MSQTLMMLRNLLVALILLPTALQVGCASGPKPQAIWPEEDVLPATPPADLDAQAPTSALRQDSQGFTYIIGGIAPDAKVGSVFVARWSGAWPMDKMARPALAMGQILRRYNDRVALVHMIYELPDTKRDDLEITWQRADAADPIGKGIARVTKLKPDEGSDAQLSLGKDAGLMPGDIYMLFSPNQQPWSLGRQATNICMVNHVEESTSTCRLWRGSGLHPWPADIKEGQLGVFMEHTYGMAPRQLTIKVARVSGERGDTLQKYLVEQLTKYTTTHPAANAVVEPLDAAPDATSPSFYREERLVPATDLPQLLVGATVRSIDGTPHLIVNYTGVGSPTGPGMVAAPPEGGIDLGPVDDIDGKKLRGLFGTIWAAGLIYRGQTSEAAIHLRQLLLDPDLQGSLRWHARDQYAMRWAALGYKEQALRLVLEDEAVALKRQDTLAYLNALGTRVRLLELLGKPKAAVEAAQTYLTHSERAKRAPDMLLGARAMLAEMHMAAGDVPAASAIIPQLEAACPDGCNGDLFGYLTSIVWSMPEGNDALQAELVTKVNALAQKDPDHAMTTMRILQGVQAMREGNFEQALIAFLESDRLARTQHAPVLVSRARYFAFLAQLAMKEPLDAYETANDLLERAQELRDWAAAMRVYERMVSIYMTLDPGTAPQAYLRVASSILLKTFEAYQAAGDLGRASDALFAIGSFFFKAQSFDHARTVLERAVPLSLRAARLDITSLSHLTLAMIARAEGRADDFRAEIERARATAKAANNPAILETIERALQPPEEETPGVDTKLL
jgi:tetratricopeptide (TPR) repeat protein